jgi:Bacterial SH3 domain
MQTRCDSVVGGRNGRLGVCGARLLFVLLAFSSFAAGSAESRWVHGSWVNVRSTASLKGEVVARLTANTQVTVLADRGEWCEVSAKTPDVRGFMSCKLLGDKPLLLSDVGTAPPYGGKADPRYSPTRAFWIAPSVVRLQAAAEFFWTTMLSDTQRQKERPERIEDWNQQPAPVRFPIPEFDAMKVLLQNGVVAAEERRPPIIRWSELKEVSADRARESSLLLGKWIDPNALELMHQGRLDPVKPSLFKRVEDLAPAGATVEELSAQFGIRERLRVLSGPQWVHHRNDNPAVAGMWDIGSYEITLDKPVVEYVVGRGGLAAAMEWEPSVTQDVQVDEGCDSGFGLAPRSLRPLPDYPRIKDPLVWIYTPKALPYKNVAIKVLAKRFEPQTDNKRSRQGSAFTLLVMHEIDLDGDGIVDLMAWEGMGRLTMDAGPNAGDTATLRIHFANIAGEWYLLNFDSFQECT